MAELIGKPGPRSPGGRLWRFLPADAAMAAILVAAMVLQVCPGAQALLEFDRARVAAGQWWRLVTCNLVHFGWPQLLADTGALAVLWWLSRRRGLGLVWPVAAGAVAVGLGVQLCGGVDVYRGLSGVNCALLAAALVDASLGRRKTAAWLWVPLLALLGSRCVYEMVTGKAIGVTSLPAGVIVVGVAHLGGVAAGVVVAGLRACRRRRRHSGGRTARGMPGLAGADACAVGAAAPKRC